jgi:flagellin-like protein
MDFKKLFMNNKAVSPVIGVILMVAITVILAAAIGSSVFGQGTARSAPQANLDIQAGDIDQFGSSSDGIDAACVRIEHLGGDPINFDSSVTKVVASVNGESSQEIFIDTNTANKGAIKTLEVGDIRTIPLRTAANKPLNPSKEDNDITDIGSGDVVNIKIIDLKTNQLICDKDLRF